MLKKTGILIMLFAATTQAEAVELRYPTLAEARPWIAPPPTPVSEREEVVRQLQFAFSQGYAHRYLKIGRLGANRADLPRRLLRLSRRLETFDDVRFYSMISRTILDLQDIHALFLMPEPQRCYMAFLPVSLAPVSGGRFNTRLVVRSIVDGSGLGDLGSVLGRIQLGDRLVAYRGRRVRQALAGAARESRGASSSSRIREAVAYLTSRQLAVYAPPAENEVSLQFISRRTSKRYEVVLPWLVLGSRMGNCDKLVPSEVASAMPPTRSGISTDDSWIKTTEPSVSYRWITAEREKVAIVRIPSFVPGGMGPRPVPNLDALSRLQALLTQEIGDAQAILFDLRDNWGGDGWLASDLASFFRTGRANIRSIMRNTEFIRSMVNLPSPPDQPYVYYTFYYESLPGVFTAGQSLTRPVPFVPFPVLPKDYASYPIPRISKPVGLFTNGRCYSACDLFAQLMKGNPGVTIFGEDATTGGAFGNYWAHSELVAVMPEEMKMRLGIRPLPHGADFRFTARQIVGSPDPGAALLEGIGVASDIILPMDTEDVLDQGIAQYRRIAEILLSQARTGQSASVR